MYGGHTRKSKKITGIGSGLKEGGKAFAFGVYDGFADLIKEPIKGGQKDGALGALKGSARGFANFNMRPLAGLTGLVAHPLQGIWASIRLDAAQKNAKIRRTARIQQGRDEVAASTPEEHWLVLKAFNVSMSTLYRRREFYKKEKRNAEKGKGKATDSDFHSVPETPRSSASSLTTPSYSNAAIKRPRSANSVIPNTQWKPANESLYSQDRYSTAPPQYSADVKYDQNPALR